MQVQKINISTDFTNSPEGRKGPRGGEDFCDLHLLPPLLEGKFIEVILDGTVGFSSAFLNEAFGGLARKSSLSYSDLKKKITLICKEDSTIIEEAWLYMKSSLLNSQSNKIMEKISPLTNEDFYNLWEKAADASDAIEEEWLLFGQLVEEEVQKRLESDSQAMKNLAVFHSTLQKIGTALDLRAGADLTTECVLAIHKLKRKKVIFFNPYTGEKRNQVDVEIDPEGTLLIDPNL